MKTFIPLSFVLVLAVSCGQGVKQGAKIFMRQGGKKAATESGEALLKQSDEFLRFRTLPETPPPRTNWDVLTRRLPAPNGTGYLNLATHDGPAFTRYVKERFKNNTSWVVEEGDDVVYLRYMGETELAGTRSVGLLYEDLCAKGGVSVCIHFDENGKASITLEVKTMDSGQNYTVSINSSEGFGLVGETTYTGDTGYLGEVDFTLVRNTTYLPRENEFTVQGDLCYPFSTSQISFETPAGSFTVSQGSLSFAF